MDPKIMLGFLVSFYMADEEPKPWHGITEHGKGTLEEFRKLWWPAKPTKGAYKALPNSAAVGFWY